MLRFAFLSEIKMTTVAACYILFGLLFIKHGSPWLLDEDCGIAVNVGPKVMNGVSAGYLENPWMALIKSPTEFICAGTLITSQFVLTAAHCVFKGRNSTENYTQLTVSLGVYNRTADKDNYHEDFNVVTSYIRDGFEQLSDANDIALLRLQRRVVYKHQIRPICIHLDSRLKPTSDAIKKFTIVGWGKTETRNSSDILRTADVYRLNKNLCYDLLWLNLTDSQICAGTTNLVDTCKGDSGGPLYSKVSDGVTWRQTQFGIVSFGAEECGGMGVYTDVMSHVDFIERVVLESDITVLLPKIDLLDEGCLDNAKLGRRAKTPPETFPWLAQVFMESFVLSYGALISDRFVLTTAELIPEEIPLKVLFGEISESIMDFYKVSSVHKHPEFTSLTRNDIALLELEKKVQYSDLIRPICLPSPTNKKEQEKFQKKANRAQELTAVGWGIRRSSMVQRVRSSECYQENLQDIGDKQICMEHPKSITSNVGSGSPLVKPLSHGNSRAFTLVGLASFGRMENHSRDVYTNVLSYVDWIGTLVKK
ncbi:polyserase-2-like [Drosophila subpulchrella]|uniref:polyserase-2-like n=1 Tax=Drosophila subpulchrella TaxID=1486046 RepID=UPI0018A1554C|nr:polyserase-2-like [Drosophila subpulchrella]